MTFRDDDDELASLSSHDRFQADKGKLKKLKEKVKEKQGQQAEHQMSGMKTEVELQQLQAKLEAQKDEETKRQRKTDEKPLKAGTKSLKEREEAAVTTAQEQASPDKLIEQAKQEQEKQDQAGQEYQQQMG